MKPKKWGKSQWCRDRNSDHGWCFNRNPEESHCTCACHKLKAQIRSLESDIETIERLISVKQDFLFKLTRFYS